MIRIILLLSALALTSAQVSVNGVHGTTITVDQNEQQTFWINSQRKWNAKNYRNYLYNIQKYCDVCCWTDRCEFHYYPWRVQINSDWRTPKAYNNRLQAVTPLSIDQIFAQIQAALSNPNQVVDVTYDPVDGYPTRYNIQTRGNYYWPAYDYTGITGFEVLFSSQTSIFLTHQNLWARERKTSYDYDYYDMGPNPQGWAFPLTVKVRNLVITSVQDRNGNAINPSTMTNPPLPLDDYFPLTSRQLDANAGYIENEYDGTIGYPKKVLILGAVEIQDVNVEIRRYQTDNIV